MPSASPQANNPITPKANQQSTNPSIKTIDTKNNEIPPFPPASTFSILPEVYSLISRLSVLPQNQSSSTTTTIDPKDLPAQIYPIKQKMAKAKAAVQALPDVQRSVREQEEEIRMLEARVGALKERIGMLGGIAGGKKMDDVEMEMVGE